MRKSIPIAVLLALYSAPAVAAEKPNVVLDLCGDLGNADVGFIGSVDIVTPELDSLAKCRYSILSHNGLPSKN